MEKVVRAFVVFHFLVLLVASIGRTQTIELRPDNELHLTTSGYAAVQIELPDGVTPTIGPDALMAGKTLHFSDVNNRMVIVGLDNTSEMTGHIANLDQHVDVNMLTGRASTPDGNDPPITFLVIFSPCDLTQDGAINTLDTLQAVSQALGAPGSCMPTGDLDNNGDCDVVDVQRVAHAAAGGPCISE